MSSQGRACHFGLLERWVFLVRTEVLSRVFRSREQVCGEHWHFCR